MSANAPAARTGELALIERIRARAGTKSPAVRLGIGDDCAILRPPPGCELLVTTDFSLEGRHFRRDTHPAQAIGHRTLARGLSDLAAMGATPLAAFLSLALPKSLAADLAFVDSFLDGLLTLAKRHKVVLAGGDTSESPTDHLLADIVLLGSAPSGAALRRSTAQAGDLIYVTGALGGSSAELDQLLAGSAAKSVEDADPDAHPQLYPQPRLATGQALRKRKLATACIDLSDGLSTDLNHLCEASGVAAELDAALLPVHPLAARLDDGAKINAILHGGEDYELLFTARPTTNVPRSIAGVPVTRIGRIVKAQKAAARMTIRFGTDPSDTDRYNTERYDLQPQGWEHLR